MPNIAASEVRILSIRICAHPKIMMGVYSKNAYWKKEKNERIAKIKNIAWVLGLLYVVNNIKEQMSIMVQSIVPP